MEQNITENKPLDRAMLDYFNWVNANIFGKERSRRDAYEYGIALNGSIVLHDACDLLKNVSTAAINYAFSHGNDLTNMLWNYDTLSAGNYVMLESCCEKKLGTAIATNTVADVGNPVTAQTIALSGLTALNYYIIFIPTNKACQVSFRTDIDTATPTATIINNTAITGVDGLPAGVNGIMFQMNTAKTAGMIKLDAALGVGLTTGTNTALKLYPVSNWAIHELKIISCSE